jgi:uncharacterized membrane protein YdfJ with MMPL/SSD domain
VSPSDRLRALRTGRYADAAVALAFAVGTAAAAVHWSGLVAAGVLVGLVAASLRRAAALGLAFSLTVLLIFLGWLAWHGDVLTWLGAGPLPLLTVGSLSLPPVAAVGVRAAL